VGPLSWTRQCSACGRANLEANIDGIHEKTGDAYIHQQARQFMAARRALIDLGLLSE
jgi:hypothetical protein